LKDGVVLRLTVNADPGRRPAVAGETNLPDGTEGIVSVISKTTNVTGQDKFSVQGGRFRTGPFGSEGSGLEPGQYTAEATVPIPQVQPPQVKAVIGANGENLHGPLVKPGSLGKTIETKVDFQLDAQGNITGGTDKVAVEKSIEASLKEARAILQALRTLEQQGHAMEALRKGYPNDLDKVRQCGEQMRARQPGAKSLRGRAEALPKQRYAIFLASAATEMNLCVSCSMGAMEYCNRAHASIEDAAKELNK
jgi:hypothetical protein